MSLSVFCLTNDPGPRVAAIMRQLRSVADEIVIAVDSRRDPERLGCYAEVADRLLRYEFVDSSLQAVPWIVAQCSGDWLLQIDGDEVFSPSLIGRLPELTRATDAFQYRVQCRWLFPDADHYLAQPPWHFSARRLVRNDPTTLWHAGLSHTPFDPVFPSVDLDEGFYHLSLLVNALSYREAKVAHYLGIESSHGRRVLEDDLTAFYLPERDRRFEGAPVPVPAGDQAAIAEVLTATGEELPSPSGMDIPLAGWRDIQRTWPRRALAEQAYLGAIEAFEREPVLRCGEQRSFTVRVLNHGDEHWPGLQRGPWIKLSHRWLSPGATPPQAWIDTCLPAGVPPGESALVPIPLQAPREVGAHKLELTLVHADTQNGKLLRRFASTSLPIDVDHG